MQNVNFFQTNSSPYLGVILALLSVVPVILTYTVFRPKNKVINLKDLGKKDRILFIVNKIIYIVNIIILVLNTQSFDIKTANIWFGVMCFFYILYYELYIRYIKRGRRQEELYSKLFFIRIPLFLSMSFALLFAGVWGKNLIITITAILFTITNLYSSYKLYEKLILKNK